MLFLVPLLLVLNPARADVAVMQCPGPGLLDEVRPLVDALQKIDEHGIYCRMAQSWNEPSLERAMDQAFDHSVVCEKPWEPALQNWEHNVTIDASCFVPSDHENEILTKQYGSQLSSGILKIDESRQASDRKLRNAFLRLGEEPPSLVRYVPGEGKSVPQSELSILLSTESKAKKVFDTRVKSRLAQCPMLQVLKREGILEEAFKNYVIGHRIECRKTCKRFQGNNIVQRMGAFSSDKKVLEVVECIENQVGDKDALRTYYDQKFPTGLCHELSHIAGQILPQLLTDFLKIRFPDFRYQGPASHPDSAKSAQYESLRTQARRKDYDSSVPFPRRYEGDRHAFTRMHEYFAISIEIVTTYGVIQPYEKVADRISRPEYDWIVNFVSSPRKLY